MRWLLVFLLAAVALLIALAVQLPAGHALGWLQRAAPALAISTAEGTLWDGFATGVTWDGYEVGELAWTVDPRGLLLGRVEALATLSGRELAGRAEIESGLAGERLELRAVELRAPAAWIQQVLAAPFLQLQGELVAQLDRVVFANGYLAALDGTTTWRDAAVDGRIVTTLGELQAVWDTRENGIQGLVSDAGGPLQASGTVAIHQHSYRVDLRLAAPDGPVELLQALHVLGRPDAQGVVRLEIEGILVPIL